MEIDSKVALSQLEGIINECEKGYASCNRAMLNTRLCAIISRLAPPGSVYLAAMERAFKPSISSSHPSYENEIYFGLIGVVMALKQDYAQNMVHVPAKSDIGAFLQIDKLLTRFHLVAQQLRTRRAPNQPLLLKDEHDVQYLLRALLRIDFEDVRPEDPTPSFAGKSSRIDFLLKDQKIGIEVKMTRDSLGEKEVGDELATDIAHYKAHPNCNTLICFIYDPDLRISNPASLKDLEQTDPDGYSVKVYVCQR